MRTWTNRALAAFAAVAILGALAALSASVWPTAWADEAADAAVAGTVGAEAVVADVGDADGDGDGDGAASAADADGGDVSALKPEVGVPQPETGENAVNTQQLPDSSFIYDTSIVALFGAETYYDNQIVQVVGEVVGDNVSAGLDGGHRWITLTAVEREQQATISAYMRTEATQKIDSYGKYGVVGTKLQVRGTFHLVCAEHEGLTDLHVDVSSVVEKGKQHPDQLSWRSFLPGAVAVAVGLALMGAYYYLRERQR